MNAIHGTTYDDAKDILKLYSLYQRRENWALKFALDCLQNEKTKHLFPLKNKKHKLVTRKSETFEVIRAKTKRLKNSTVQFLQRILNEYKAMKKS